MKFTIVIHRSKAPKLAEFLKSVVAPDEIIGDVADMAKQIEDSIKFQNSMASVDRMNKKLEKKIKRAGL